MPPVVTTIHSPSDWIGQLNREPASSRAEHELGAMELECARWSDGLVSPSHAMAGWVQQQWGIERESIDIIPYPLGDAGIAEQIDKEPAPDDGEFRLLFIGRQEPRKGVDTLLEALASTDDVRISLDLVGGDAPDPDRKGMFGRNTLAAIGSRLAPGRVRLHGRRPPGELPEFRRAAHAVVIPSPMDNFPYVCVEAMAAGSLVIASAAGGTSEMIRDGVDGLLFAPGDASACARAIKSAVAAGPAQRRKMATSGAQRIREMCGNSSILERRLAQFRKVIGSRRTSGDRGVSGPITCINRGRASDASVAQLVKAVEATGDDFAHGWTRTESGVEVFTTPRVRTLGLCSRALGPIVVRESAIARAGVRGLLRADPAGGWTTESSWAVAMELCAGGCRGVCVPDVVEPVSASDVHPAERALLDELKSIRGSRGWRVLNRVYDVLHVVRGRGLRRPYHSRPRGKHP